jgi:bifunctional DNA-binding transcriptional regulator/antitoxin component of YhaV-PrlF toxin-antitoxin module
MKIKTLSISDKGQVVIPKEFIKHLGSKIIKLVVRENQEVSIVPVIDVAGSLANFAKKQKIEDFNVLRNQAWDQSISDKFNKA